MEAEVLNTTTVFMVFLQNGTGDKLGEPTLQRIYELYQSWLAVQDTNRIDIVLATALTRTEPGIPVWLIVVGASGDWKSEQLDALEEPSISKLIGRISPNTLVSGDKKAEDLAPKLDGKLFLIKDMAQILTLPPDHKAAIWAQLRDLYDGSISKAAGTGVDKTYKVHTTLIAATTPVIDEQILQGQALGTRELIWRTNLSEKPLSAKQIMMKCMENEEHQERMKRELKFYTQEFLRSHHFQRSVIPPNIDEFLQHTAQFIALMRAVGETDNDGNLRNLVYPEQPTRVLKQLKRIYLALKSLDENYSDEKALACVTHLARSVAHPVRLSVLKTLYNNVDQPKTTNYIAHYSKVGNKSANTHLSVLRAVGLVTRIYEEETNQWGRITEKVTWQIDKQSEWFSAVKFELGI